MNPLKKKLRGSMWDFVQRFAGGSVGWSVVDSVLVSVERSVRVYTGRSVQWLLFEHLQEKYWLSLGEG